MRRAASILQIIAHRVRGAVLDLGRELSRLNNVAEIDASGRLRGSDRAARVKEWMRERSGNRARCC